MDFAVDIESAAGGGYRVRASSPQAEAESLTRFDFDLERLKAGLSFRVSGALPGTQARDLANSAGAPAASPDLMEMGRNLFAALFAGEVGVLYGSAWSAALAADQGLRIRLHLRPRTPELAGLTKIPWEILFDERAGGFPCLNPLSPVIRHLDLPRPVERVPFRMPLRVLVVAANPAGLSALDLKGEQDGIRASRRVRVQVLEGRGPEDLRRELCRGENQGGYQIVHFMGHGLSDADQGSLVFATEEGRARTVTGNELSQIAQGSPALGLALLNACHSAADPKGSGADPLAGVAGSLVRGGLPAVVGMQFAISDRAALTFSRVLYERLAEGDPIEVAVSEARLAIYLADSSSSDWVAPVLFMRGSDRRIEEEDMKEKRTERALNQASLKSPNIEADEIVFTGAFLPEEAQAPCDSSVKVEAELTRAKKLTITGSDFRKAK
ncbi:MAG TPA: CHAT domain-containing protein [Thermoanaerobaculia bacterium]